MKIIVKNVYIRVQYVSLLLCVFFYLFAVYKFYISVKEYCIVIPPTLIQPSKKKNIIKKMYKKEKMNRQ